MLFSDLRELKTALEIDPEDTSEDKKLTLFLSHASSWIEEIIGRPGMSKQERTEYYNGTGTENLLLRSRPVFTTPTIQVFLDDSGYWGATSGCFAANTALTYGVDFALAIDQDDGTSRSGILVKINDVWNKRAVRNRGLLSPFLAKGQGNIKVVYTAGYTVDSLPDVFRAACNLLVSRLNYIWPLGVELNSEGYEERSISIVTDQKLRLTALVRPMLEGFRNRTF